MNKRLSRVLIALLSVFALAAAGCSSRESHDLSYVAAHEATCFEAGTVAHWHCNDCGENFSDASALVPLKNISVPQLEHDFSEPKTNRISCSEQGEAKSVCRHCGNEKITHLAPGEHIFRSYETLKPACFTSGERVRVCIACGQSETEIIPALGKHSFSSNNVCQQCDFTCFPSEGLIFTLIVEDGSAVGYSVSGGSATGNIVIPYYYKSLPVLEIEADAFRESKLSSFVNYASLRKIGNGAFFQCIYLSNILLPDTLECIEDDAFSECSSLRSVTIPDSVRKIGERAFYACSQIRDISLGKHVSFIGDNAFRNCERLSSVSVSDENSIYAEEGNCLIERSTKTLFLGCAQSIIPDYIATIGASAFFGRTGLTKIVIPASVIEIQDFAFRDCINLQEIVYKGTREQWESIPKGNEWNAFTSSNLSITFLE